MPQTLSAKRPKAEFRPRSEFPVPSIEEIEEHLPAVLTPGVFAPLRMVDQRSKLRERILTLPVLSAIVVSLVWRRIPSLSEVLRVLASEGLLWVEALRVSKQALSKRLETLPACLFAQLFQDVLLRLPSRPTPASRPGEEAVWKPVIERFGAVWIADASTLEALKKKLARLQSQASALGGRSSCSSRPSPIAPFPPGIRPRPRPMRRPGPTRCWRGCRSGVC